MYQLEMPFEEQNISGKEIILIYFESQKQLNGNLHIMCAELTSAIKCRLSSQIVSLVLLVAQKDNIGDQIFFFPCFCF